MNRDAVVARRTKGASQIHPVTDFSCSPGKDDADHLDHPRRLVIR